MLPSILRLLKNYSNARQSWEAWCFMINFNCDKSDKARLAYIDKNDLLFHLRYLALKDFHIEIYKVVKQGRFDTDSIFKLLKEAAESDKTKVNIVEANIFELEQNRKIIDELCDISDKFYAHLD